MSPEEWNTGVNNEADHAPDPTWANEARAYVRGQAWRHDLVGLGLGLAIIQGVLLLQVLKMPLMLQLSEAGQRGWFWTNLTDVPLFLAAATLAWGLGRRGYRAWPVALGFLLFPVVKEWTQELLAAAQGAGLSPTLGLVWSGKVNPLDLEALLLWEGLALLAFVAATLGARQARRRSSTIAA